MWLNHVQKAVIVKSVFLDNIPSLNNIELNTLKIEMGGDLGINLNFDLPELPLKMPEKWIKSGVNTVQLNLLLLGAEILLFKLTNTTKTGNFFINEECGCKLFVYKNDDGEILKIKTKWIYIQSILGYKKGIGDIYPAGADL